MGQGVAEIDLFAPDELYDEILKEIVGVEIRGKDHLLELMQDFAHAKTEYDQISDALKWLNKQAMDCFPITCRYESRRTRNYTSRFQVWCSIKGSRTFYSYD